MIILERVAKTGLGAVFLLAGCAGSTEQTEPADETVHPVEESTELADADDAEESTDEEEENLGALSTEIRRGDRDRDRGDRGDRRGRGEGRRGHGRRGWHGDIDRGFHGRWIGHGFRCNPHVDAWCRGATWGWRWGRYGREWGWRFRHRGGWAWSPCDPRRDWRCRDYYYFD